MTFNEGQCALKMMGAREAPGFLKEALPRSFSKYHYQIQAFSLALCVGCGAEKHILQAGITRLLGKSVRDFKYSAICNFASLLENQNV